MEHEEVDRFVNRPPLRKFLVRTSILANGPEGSGTHVEEHTVTAHLVFDNSNRGEGLVFRRYYEDNVRTEKVAEFQAGTWLWYKEIN